MNYKRYQFLIESFSQGYKVDLKKLVVISKSGKKLSITKNKKRAPIVTVRSKQYSITEVIGTWLGMDVIDNYCFFKDGDAQNYHPGNLVWLDKKEGNTWINLERPPAAKLNRNMVDFIRNFDLVGSGVKCQDLADMYGVSLHTIKDLRTKSKGKWPKIKKPRERIRVSSMNKGILNTSSPVCGDKYI